MPHFSKLRVCCRLRPCGERENGEAVCSAVENDRVLLRDPRHKGVDKVYSFDRVYRAEESNDDIFQEEFGREGLSRLFDGQNFTVFAHGATGSGKTFTMQGGNGAVNGVVPQAIETLFTLLANQTDKYVLKFSLYEIYCEKIRDLLQDSTADDTGTSRNNEDRQARRYPMDDLPIQKDFWGFEVVADIKQEILTSPDHFNRLYSRIQLRRTERTNVNDTSSRSHCCAQIIVEKVGSETKEKLKRGSAMTFHEKPATPQIGRLFLVDLAGCEDNRHTGNKGQRMTESQFINDTYLALVKVFGAIRRKAPLSAFCRDAKLTRLLRGALEDKDSPSLVFITVSPSLSKFQATLNTFSYLHFQGESAAKLRPQSPATGPLLQPQQRRPQSAVRGTRTLSAGTGQRLVPCRRSFSAGDDPVAPQTRVSTVVGIAGARQAPCVQLQPKGSARPSRLLAPQPLETQRQRPSESPPSHSAKRLIRDMSPLSLLSVSSGGLRSVGGKSTEAGAVPAVPLATAPIEGEDDCKMENTSDNSPELESALPPAQETESLTLPLADSAEAPTPLNADTPPKSPLDTKPAKSPIRGSSIPPKSPSGDVVMKSLKSPAATKPSPKSPTMNPCKAKSPPVAASKPSPARAPLSARRLSKHAKLSERSPLLSRNRMLEVYEETCGVTPIIKESRLAKPRQGCNRGRASLINCKVDSSPRVDDAFVAERKAPPTEYTLPREYTRSVERTCFTRHTSAESPGDVAGQLPVTETWNQLMRLGYGASNSRLASIRAHGDKELAIKYLEETGQEN